MRAGTVFSLFFAAAFSVVTWSDHGHAAFDPIEIYGNEHRFTILRNDEIVGTHLVRFSSLPDGLSVEARFELQVKFLFFTAFRYDYRSVATWRDGRLVRLETKTND
ncbi:MAG: hypothetical protein MI741_10855, partial [Rhodospirillales bacterium]|nr:hypothetical protein [Rhodospirillales bacterium]